MADDDVSASAPVTAPFRIDDVPWMEWSEGVRFGGRFRRLGAHGGGSHVGVRIVELPPGKQSSPVHYHLLEEEHLLALDGQATLILGDRTYLLSAGEYICFPAGQRSGHALVNHTDAVFRFLMIGENNPHEVVVYPGSDKVSVRLTRSTHRGSATLGHWDGEYSDLAIDFKRLHRPPSRP